jgi:hypothetical protein
MMNKLMLSILGLTLAGGAARAQTDTVTVGSTYSGGFDMLVYGNVDAGVGGGNVGGSTGVINGVTYNWAAFYCADLFTDASLNTTYNALYNQDGVIGGNSVASAGQIAWLVQNLGTTVSSQAQSQGLQGLIWTLESPGIVTWDYADNSSDATYWYTTYTTELGSHSESPSDVWWINPINDQGEYAYQGFVAATWTEIPEPISLSLLGTGTLALAAMVGSRRRIALA